MSVFCYPYQAAVSLSIGPLHSPFGVKAPVDLDLFNVSAKQRVIGCILSRGRISDDASQTLWVPKVVTK